MTNLLNFILSKFAKIFKFKPIWILASKNNKCVANMWIFFAPSEPNPKSANAKIYSERKTALTKVAHSVNKSVKFKMLLKNFLLNLARFFRLKNAA